MRIYELAREVNIPSKELVKVFLDLDIKVKNHMSSISDKAVEKVRRKLDGKEPIKETPKEILAPEKEPVPNEVPKEQEQEQESSEKSRSEKKIDLPAVKRIPLEMTEPILVRELSEKMEKEPNKIIHFLLSQGIMSTLNQTLERDIAIIAADAFGYELLILDRYGDEEIKKQMDKETGKKVSIPPVVTVMGHVDHGKTLLLDAIRKTHVTSSESGGITQQIGAYRVRGKKGDICFIDTPGHAAFTEMRARGAEVTHIVILVVAADDGVMPQTIEAINHAKAANTPIIVAINKIDLPSANPDKVKKQLMEYKLTPEEWGGETLYVDVSAKEKLNIDKLLETIDLQAEIMELRARNEGPAKATVIEAHLDKSQGPIASVIVKEGLLKKGDSFVCGTEGGKVRALQDEWNHSLSEVSPSMPCLVLGFSGVPRPGEEFLVVESEKRMRRILEQRKSVHREESLAKRSSSGLEKLMDLSNDTKTGKILLKTNSQGAIEVLIDLVRKASTEKVKLETVHAGVGAINETDIALAAATGAIVIGFNIRPTPAAKKMADQEKIHLILENIIYKISEYLENLVQGLVKPVFEDKTLGYAEVRKVFRVNKSNQIAGCLVTEGLIRRGGTCRLIRDHEVIFESRIGSLRRIKDDVKEIKKGFECGIGIENFQDIKTGDLIEVFEKQQVPVKS